MEEVKGGEEGKRNGGDEGRGRGQKDGEEV